MSAVLATEVLDRRQILKAIREFRNGDFSVRLPLDLTGIDGEIALAFNDVVQLAETVTNEFARISDAVGKEGQISQRAKVDNAMGSWRLKVDAVNTLIGDLVQPTTEVARVIGAVANGDLSQQMNLEIDGRPLRGEFLRNGRVVNTMVHQLGSFASEVSRVAREVGTEGKLGGQAQVPGVAGTWKDLTDNVNAMASNLTAQVRNIAEVTTAVANGDLSKKITVDVKGEILELKNTVNTMVDQLRSFASEVSRVAREVGTEGKLGGQAQVPGVAGTWKDLTDNVNAMASNLTGQVRNIADVTKAVAAGDLSRKITVDVKGEILELKNTVNTAVDQLNSFASEVSRVAREVGTEGILGGQAQVKGVAGTWKDLTDNVNAMARNLTGQVRNIAEVTTAVANGDLSKKITVDVKGEILELKNTVNTMVDQLNSFASEVSRVAREVGSEGKLGGQAQVPGVAGTWKGLTDNVNAMAGNLTGQVRNIADVATSIAKGDLSKKITVDVKGEILELKNTVNTMVDQLNAFASEVSRVAREVGTEGKLGGQAQVLGVAGTWKDLTDNVNFMAGNLTSQVRNIADVTKAVAAGDLSKKITVDVRGEILQLKDTINTMVDQLRSFASEVTRVAREVGTEGRLGGQAFVQGVAGVWKDLTDNVNFMAGNLTSQVRNIADVTTAVAKGDLSRKITVDVKGEILELKDTVNTMVDQLNAFASEVSRVAREVGTEGKLGGQAQVKGVAGTWKDLTDNVNFMAGNLTSQVRGIANVVTAVANGDLKRKLVVEAKGEIAALRDTINSMIDTLATFADQVTDVAREVGIEGKLGGQARVPGAAGLWRDLTDNVNQLAANLTSQVRAIAEVATAVTKGDLTRTIKVEAKGEVAALKDNINEMIRNLKDTTLKNTEQDWLKTNLAKFTRMLQGQRDLATVSKLILSELAPLVNAQHGVFYTYAVHDDKPQLELLASYAYKRRKGLPSAFQIGEGLIGQCAYEKRRILLSEAPGSYIQIGSALGNAAPLDIIVLPVLFEGEVKAVIELASFARFSETHKLFLDQLTESIGIVWNTIAANMRTEDLLKQSQSLTIELQSQQEELKKTNDRLEQQAVNLQNSETLLKKQQEELQTTNAELQEKARLLSEQKEQVELKNQEVEQAKVALEEKAEQLALSSRYKSEFLANMSHELRTPLNSLLILGRLLAENTENNLTQKQIEFAKTIYSSGTDLLCLINDILDLSKIESGTVTLNIGAERFSELHDYVDRTFRQVVQDKGLEFKVELDPDLPPAIQTDVQRLQQILKNLLSNAAKFTEQGEVTLSVERVKCGWTPGHAVLDHVPEVIAFSVHDSGIGIASNKQKIIFEAFQQADGTTSRKYGGTGLGLSISRELARLLGGEISIESAPGKGSTFTLFLPLKYIRRSDKLQTVNYPPVEAEEVVTLQDTDAMLLQQSAVKDDRDAIVAGDKVLMIVEDDENFASVLLHLAHKQSYKGIIALRAATALQLAKKIVPDAITLDLALPDMDGWTLLDLLKHDLDTRHIPVTLISGTDERPRARRMGAIGFIVKPAQPEQIVQALAEMRELKKREGRTLLVIEPAAKSFYSIAEILGQGIEAKAVDNGKHALKLIAKGGFDGVVIGSPVSDMKTTELLEKMGKLDKLAPVIIYRTQPIPRREQNKLKALSNNLVFRVANSPEALFDAATLFLHREVAALPKEQREMLDSRRQHHPELAGKKVLIVDDDIRNIFALTSVLERHDMVVSYSENGRDGIDCLKRNPELDIVLMDVMMPDMDGYETMQRIRAIPQFARLPMIALTAKAMKGDREKCIEAGASDYIAKPVNIEQLLSMLRVSLSQ
jgi:HAMP domain-containing protein/signal transduction histidine kinase/DNA-binding response OmpR family regulator